MAYNPTDASVQKVIVNVKNIYGKKRISVLALCKDYADKAQWTAKESQGLEQGAGRFWTNQTSRAVKGIRGFADMTEAYALWGIKHTMTYGKDLELKKNRERAVLEPTVRELAPDFMDEVRDIYAD
jgi:hypothetical protein